MKKIKTDDIYVFTFFDEIEQEVGTGIAESIEEFQIVCGATKILSWINITGKDMSVGEFVVNNFLKAEDEDDRK